MVAFNLKFYVLNLNELNIINCHACFINAFDDQSKLNYILEELRIFLWNFLELWNL